MVRYHAEPLDLATWVNVLTKVRATSDDETHIELTQSVRRAFYLATLAPDPLWRTFAPSINEEALERTLDQRDMSQAVSGLLGADLEVEISKPEGKHIAVVRASDLSVSGSAISIGPIAASLNALIDCMLAAARQVEDERVALNAVQHRYRSGPHPSSMRH